MIQEITNQNLKKVTENTDKLIILDFFANWCGHCSQFEPVLDNVNKLFDENIIIGKIDVDAEEGLAADFDVESIPTLFFMKNGKIINKSVGIYEENELEETIKKLM